MMTEYHNYLITSLVSEKINSCLVPNFLSARSRAPYIISLNHAILHTSLFKAFLTLKQHNVFSQQDLHTFDLEDFKFGKTKISSFRLVDTANPELQSLLADWDLLSARVGRHSKMKKPENIQVDIQ